MIVPTFSPPLCAQCGDVHKLTTPGAICSGCDGDGLATGPPESRPCRRCNGVGRRTNVRDCTSEPCTLVSAIDADPCDNTRRLVLADWCDKRDRPEAARDLRLWVAQQAVVENIDADAPRLAWAKIAESVPADEAALEEVRNEIENSTLCTCMFHGCSELWGDAEGHGCEAHKQRVRLRASKAVLARTISLHRRVEFIRVQCELEAAERTAANASLYENRSLTASEMDRLVYLRQRERELLKCDACLGTGFHRYYPDLGGRPNFSNSAGCGWCNGSGRAFREDIKEVGVSFSRGFISAVGCSWAMWIDYGQKLVMGAEVCRRCSGQGRLSRREYDAASGEMEWPGMQDCSTCSGRRRIPRPFSGSEQPVIRLVLDTPIDLEWQIAASIRHATTLSNDQAALVRAEWPQLREVMVPPR